jgi:hypothetical protein
MMNDEYRSYLLQMWRVQTNGDSWRAQLVDVATSERHGFATLEKLVAFLETLGGVKEQTGKEAADGIEQHNRVT